MIASSYENLYVVFYAQCESVKSCHVKQRKKSMEHLSLKRDSCIRTTSAKFYGKSSFYKASHPVGRELSSFFEK